MRTWGALRIEEYDRKLEENRIKRQKDEEERGTQKRQEKEKVESGRKQPILDLEGLDKNDHHSHNLLVS